MEENEKIVEVRVYAKTGIETGGLVLWIRSARVEEIFQRMSLGKKIRTVGKNNEEEAHAILGNPSLAWLKGTQIWEVKNPPALPSENWAWGALTRPLAVNGFNLKILTFVGLSEGMEFPLDIPMSNSMLRALVKSVKESCRELLIEYGKAEPRFSATLTAFDLAAPTPSPVLPPATPPRVL